MASDIERRLQAALHETVGDVAVATPDPQDFRARLTRDSSRAWRWRWFTPLVSAVAVVGMWLMVGLILGRPGASNPFQQPTVLHVNSQPKAPGGVLRISDFSFVSDTEGWLLAAGSCGSGTCNKIEHTVDGGASWTAVATPGPGSTVGVTPTSIASLRFADPQHGYAYGLNVFYQTADGGQSWQPEPGGASSLEVTNGVVLRVNRAVADCTKNCSFTVESAKVGSATWNPIRLVGLVGSASRLVRTGHRAAIAILDGPVTSSNPAGLLYSADDGASWTRRSDPCAIGNSLTGLTSAPDRSISVLCTDATGASYVRTSLDGASSFGPARRFSVKAGAVTAFGSPNSVTVVVAVTDGHTDVLYRSVSGSPPTEVARASFDSTAAARVHLNGIDTDGVEAIGFEDAVTGRWLPANQSSLYATTDAGLHWRIGGPA